MVTHTFDHSDCTGVAHCKPLTDHTADEHFTARGAVEDDVAGDDVVLSAERRVGVRTNDYAAT